MSGSRSFFKGPVPLDSLILVMAILALGVFRSEYGPWQGIKDNFGFVSFLKCMYVDSVNGEYALNRSCTSTISQTVMSSESATSLRLKGYLALYDGRVEDAITYYDRALQLEEHPFSYWGLGAAFEDLARYEKAIEAMKKANNAGYVVAQLEGDLAAADLRDFAKAAINQNISAGEAYLFLGQSKFQNDRAGAIAALEASISMAREPATRAEAHYLLGELRYEEDKVAADGHFRQAIAAEPENITIYYSIVRFYQDVAQELDIAMRWAKLMETEFPEASLTHDALGWLWWLKGDEERALSHYQQATVEPDNTIQPWTFGRQGNIYMSRAQYLEAQKSFEGALTQTKSGSAPLSSRLIAALLALGKCTEAQAKLEQMATEAVITGGPERELLELDRERVAASCGVP